MNKPAVKRVLHIAHGLSSYNNSLIELLRKLQAANVEVIVASHIDLSEVLAQQSIRFEHLTRDRELLSRCDAEIKACNSGSKLQRIRRKLEHAHRYRQMSLQNDEIAALIRESEADTLLIDMECHFSILTAIKEAEHASYRIVLCSRWFSVFRASGLPPMHTTLQPNQVKGLPVWANWLNRAAITLAWERLSLHKKISTLRYRLSVRRLLPVVYDSISRVDLAALCQGLSLNLSKQTSTRHWLIPHIYTELPVMSLTAEALEFPQAIDPRMHYVGAMVGKSNQSGARFHAALAEFDAFMERPNVDKTRLVYCSFSTFWATDIDRIKPILEVFQNRPDLALVVGLGGKSKPEGLGTLPENILVLEYAPQIDILAKANVAISHGGISTINEALFHGVPLLLYSSGHVDQDGCMARVVYHKVGLSVSAGPIRAMELEAQLDKLLDKSSCDSIRSNVKRIQTQLHRYESDNSVLEMLRSVEFRSAGKPF